jgi:HEAT repeat protein
MNATTDQQINILLRRLYDDDLHVRMSAIEQLGDIGDELCLKELREKLKLFNEEHKALIIAVGKLKKKFLK